MESPILMGLAAGLGTCLGAAGVLLFDLNLRKDLFSFFLGLAAGVMLAVIACDLLPASLHQGNLSQCLGGIFTGLFFTGGVDLLSAERIPGIGPNSRYLAMGYLIAFGIAIHDLPEGLAIAASCSGPLFLGPLITLAIGLHNIPEGMATAAPLRAGGMSAFHILTLNIFLSLVTPLGAALGALLIGLSPRLIPFLLAFAGGAMAYIVLFKLIPESFRHRPSPAWGGIFAGTAFVALLNVLF
ncbi:MAG: ZIP family metal transporter [Desulfotomaculales bacterium]